MKSPCYSDLMTPIPASATDQRNAAFFAPDLASDIGQSLELPLAFYGLHQPRTKISLPQLLSRDYI